MNDIAKLELVSDVKKDTVVCVPEDNAYGEPVVKALYALADEIRFDGLSNLSICIVRDDLAVVPPKEVGDKPTIEKRVVATHLQLSGDKCDERELTLRVTTDSSNGEIETVVADRFVDSHAKHLNNLFDDMVKDLAPIVDDSK